MANDLTTLVGGVTALTGVVGAAAFGAVVLRRRRVRPYLPGGHALVSPLAADPLSDVLRHNLAGLTVGVQAGPHGELYVGFGTPQPGRTLRRLVLAPLFDRARGGRLCSDQAVPFRLVIEFGGPDRDAGHLLRAYRKLDQQLRDHAPVLSRWTGGRLEPGAVTVAVTGVVDVRELLAAETHRYAFADGSFDDVGSPTAPAALVPMISEPWSRRFGWDGREPIPAEERHLLHGLLRAAHEDGRTVRICCPATGPRAARQAIWTELAAAGVDVIADLDQAGLAAFLRRHPLPQKRPSPRQRAGVHPPAKVNGR